LVLGIAADQITIGQVLRFVEDTKKTRRSQDSPFNDVWKRVDEAISGILDQTTFADLVRRWKQSQSRFVASWEI
jgi:DNA-binding IscR family transcriptional regulator